MAANVCAIFIYPESLPYDSNFSPLRIKHAEHLLIVTMSSCAVCS